MTIPMRKVYKLSVALSAPFLIAGCGMPIGVQIASLIADSVSMITTDKTLTDHGLSAMTQKDCALWRGVKGEDICQGPDYSLEQMARATLPNANTDIKNQKPEPNNWRTAAANANNKIIPWKQWNSRIMTRGSCKTIRIDALPASPSHTRK